MTSRKGAALTSRDGARLLLGLGAAIVALTLVALSLHVPGSIWVGTIARKDGVVGLMLASGVAYAAAVWVVCRVPMAQHMVWAVLGVALLLRICLIAAPPFMSSDVYRYVWDGRVQAAGINPYLYVANDPALASLPHDAIYARMNRVDYAHTIYPPAAQLIYAAVAQVSQTVTAMKIALAGLEAFGIAAILAMLRRARLPLSRVLIYAWNPLAAWAVTGDGHIDGAAIGLLGLAMLAAMSRRGALTGALLGAAILTKFLPIVVAPALWRRWDWKMPVVCAATILALYALYLKAGWLVLGFLPNYTHEEGLAQGSGFWLLGALSRFMPMPPVATAIYLGACVAALAVLAVWIAFRQRDAAAPVRLADNVALLAAGTIAAMSPHYPWYYAWLALPLCLSVRPAILWLSVAPLFLYSDPFHDEIAIPTAVFVPAIILAAMDAFAFWPRIAAPAPVRSA